MDYGQEHGPHGPELSWNKAEQCFRITFQPPATIYDEVEIYPELQHLIDYLDAMPLYNTMCWVLCTHSRYYINCLNHLLIIN